MLTTGPCFHADMLKIVNGTVAVSYPEARPVLPDAIPLMLRQTYKNRLLITMEDIYYHMTGRRPAQFY